jgi:ATP-dependent exoDNAse (exonuclease V) alpha subunit
MTLHKFKNKMKKQTYLKCSGIKKIFIDEISMVHEIYYKFMVLLKKLNPKLIFIITGDYAQLLPVNDRYTSGQYENSQVLHELCDGNRFELNHCRRSDSELFNVCQDIKNDVEIDLNLFGNEESEINLCYTNKKRISINRHFMNKKKGGLFLPKREWNENSQNVHLYVGTPIISYKNDKAKNIVNNETFIIDRIYKKKIYFRNEKKSQSITIKKFQKFFFVAYAMTIHKAQGSTFNTPYTIHQWERLDKRLRYVALSRGTKLNLINII